MFISVLKIFKIGIGPSSSHTVGPMVAAKDFINKVGIYLAGNKDVDSMLVCTLKGSLSLTGKGHSTDSAIVLGLQGYSAIDLINLDVGLLTKDLQSRDSIKVGSDGCVVMFCAHDNIVFDKGPALLEHPNGMIFELIDKAGKVLFKEVYFSLGGGFISTLSEMHNKVATESEATSRYNYPYPFASAESMLQMAAASGLTIAGMKRANELIHISEEKLNKELDLIWQAMHDCIINGLSTKGILPGSLFLPRRAKNLHDQLIDADKVSVNDWLCAYAMAVNEENAAGHMVVTAPTNGAAGVIPAVIYYFATHEGGTKEQIRELILTASAVGSIIKHLASISGAEVGCQGEVGSAASMAAAGLCAMRGCTPQQIENAAEIALEHHLGMTCDPVNGLVQIPCIERNGFGAIKAHAASSLAMRGTGKHVISLDSCISAMKQTGLEMSDKYKETSQGGLAVSFIEC